MYVNITQFKKKCHLSEIKQAWIFPDVQYAYLTTKLAPGESVVIVSPSFRATIQNLPSLQLTLKFMKQHYNLTILAVF